MQVCCLWWCWKKSVLDSPSLPLVKFFHCISFLNQTLLQSPAAYSPFHRHYLIHILLLSLCLHPLFYSLWPSSLPFFFMKNHVTLFCTLSPVTCKFATLFHQRIPSSSSMNPASFSWFGAPLVCRQSAAYVYKSHYSLFQCLTTQPAMWCRDQCFTSVGLWAQSRQGDSSSMQSCW